MTICLDQPLTVIQLANSIMFSNCLFYSSQQTFSKCLRFARYYASWRDTACHKEFNIWWGVKKSVLICYRETACLVKRRNHCHGKTKGINFDCRIWEGFMERLALYTKTQDSWGRLQGARDGRMWILGQRGDAEAFQVEEREAWAHTESFWKARHKGMRAWSKWKGGRHGQWEAEMEC